MLPLHLAMIDGATGPMIDVRPSAECTNLSPLLTTGVFWQALIEAYPEAASIDALAHAACSCW